MQGFRWAIEPRIRRLAHFLRGIARVVSQEGFAPISGIPRYLSNEWHVNAVRPFLKSQVIMD